MKNFFNNDLVSNELIYLEKCRQILFEKFYKKNRTPKFFLHSFGCQGNLSESEKIKGMLFKMGYSETDSFKNADFVIFNTCAVRENAQNRVLGNLGILVHHKKKNNPNMIIAVCGCMVQQKHVAKKISSIFSEIDLIFGTHTIHMFARMVFQILTKHIKIVSNDDSSGLIVEGLPLVRNSNLIAFVPISFGCNNFCSYCIVPYVKGRERSRNFEVVVNEVKNLIKSGYKEIVLLGQNVNSYGFDFENSNKFNFSNLLLKLNEIDGKFRIRFLTSHPKNLTKNLIDIIANCEKVCCHIHLPVQSGSDRILSLMNRGYNTANYLNLVDYAKSKIEGLNLTTDIIVGFPGETYNDFKQTLKLVQKVQFSSIFNFIFSKRVGTKAAEMEDIVSKNEKTKWLTELINCQNEISEKIHESYVNKIEEVLFEDVLKNNNEVIYGKTNSNLIVRCKTNRTNLKKFKKVKITNFSRTYLLGEIL